MEKFIRGTKKVTSISHSTDKEVLLANEIIENCRYGLSTNGFKLLMAFISCIDYSNAIWPEFSFDIRGLFKFFGINDNNGKRYDIIRNALQDIGRNPLEYKVSKKRWGEIYWLSDFDYDENKSYFVNISFNPKVMPYLMSFKYNLSKAFGKQSQGYTYLMQGQCDFRCKYGPALYPYFKKWEDKKTGKEVVITKEILWVREKTYTENLYPKVYDWLQRVVNPVIEETNKYKDVFIKPISVNNGNIRAEGKGRTYTHIDFVITSKKPQTPKEESQSPHRRPRTVEDLHKLYSLVTEVTYEQLYAEMSSTGFEASVLAKMRGMTYHRIKSESNDKHYFCK